MLAILSCEGHWLMDITLESTSSFILGVSRGSSNSCSHSSNLFFLDIDFKDDPHLLSINSRNNNYLRSPTGECVSSTFSSREVLLGTTWPLCFNYYWKIPLPSSLAGPSIFPSTFLTLGNLFVLTR